ncbi:MULTISPECIES: metal ABC transporter ATP-binding protein [unclassified Microbacterium]|uniref:metal ABC transporter ATP-binding protein n=1 Tax=unclassified Microbacterium TaxID=2609290 RepID=UPI00301A6516
MTSLPAVRPMDAVAARLRGVGVSFRGVPAILDVDLDVEVGELTVITGPNGAGKSTLLEVIAGARDPSVGGHVAAPEAVAFVPQRAQVPDGLPVTVRDIVRAGTWGRRGPRVRRRADRRRVIAEAIDRMDLGALTDRPFGELSGGQRQRALLAQALAGRPRLLLLDEPTTGLDRASSARIRTVMRDEADGGAAVVCVSHDAAVIGDADRRVSMDGGRIVAVTRS